MLTELSRQDRRLVNNDYYDILGQDWSSGREPAVELLKAEGRLKNAWVKEVLRKRFAHAQVLDIGCGGGFLTNELAKEGWQVTGLDQSIGSLHEAEMQDRTKRVQYVQGDAYELPFADASFNVVVCFDFLEHVSRPELVLKEAIRVLKPNGLFFYHTFDRNHLAGLIVIKGVEWFVQNAPRHLHCYRLFVPRRWWNREMQRAGLTLVEERGLRPCLNRSFWKLLRTGKVDARFRFRWTTNKMISYAGLAEKI